MSEHEPLGCETAFSFENARQFIDWMYSKYPFVDTAQIPDSYLPTVFGVLREKEDERLNGIKDRRRKKQMQAPLDFMKRWVAGQSFYQIFKETEARSEDSVHFALISHAERLGEAEDLDDLMAKCEEKAAAHAAAAEEMKQQIIKEEAQIVPEPEPEPIEVEATEEPEQAAEVEVLEAPQEVGRLVVQEVVEEPMPAEEFKEPETTEEPPQLPAPEENQPEAPADKVEMQEVPEEEIPEMPPSAEEIIDIEPKVMARFIREYPIIAKLSHKAAVQLLKQVGRL